MNKLERNKNNAKTFYKITLFIMAALTLSACVTESATQTGTPPANAQRADTLYINGVIWTGSDVVADAAVMAVTDGLISYIGTERDPRIVAPATVDLQGRFVMPGFIDNHVHFLEGGAALASVDLRDADTPDTFSR
ncbi:MAG: amidohydrolase family protein, partial [Woeseia sp.]|nr:amidohydrolase family protein [Woeseia sp.]